MLDKYTPAAVYLKVQHFKWEKAGLRQSGWDDLVQTYWSMCVNFKHKHPKSPSVGLAREMAVCQGVIRVAALAWSIPHQNPSGLIFRLPWQRTECLTFLFKFRASPNTCGAAGVSAFPEATLEIPQVKRVRLDQQRLRAKPTGRMESWSAGSIAQITGGSWVAAVAGTRSGASASPKIHFLIWQLCPQVDRIPFNPAQQLTSTFWDQSVLWLVGFNQSVCTRWKFNRDGDSWARGNSWRKFGLVCNVTPPSLFLAQEVVSVEPTTWSGWSFHTGDTMKSCSTESHRSYVGMATINRLFNCLLGIELTKFN